jgi:MurNAc alpha-1-phosphate uridylyltransferase
MTTCTPAFTHAMILAAGLGLRMRPLTLERPKPLVRVAGRTLLDHALDRLDEAGIGTVVVNTHYKPEMIERHLAERASPRTVLSPEPELLETGGGVRRALPHLGDGPFVTVNSDALWLDGPSRALDRLARAWDPARMDVLLLLHPTVAAVGFEGPGDFRMDPDGKVHRRPAGLLAPFVFAGVQVTTAAAYADMPDGPFSNNLVWDRALARERLYGVRHDGLWFHVGTPDAIPEVEVRMDYVRPCAES